MKMIKLLITTLLISSCTDRQSKQLDSDNVESKVIIDTNSVNDTSSLHTTINYDKSLVLNGYLAEIKDSLKQNKVPIFFIDECLDVSTMGYCQVNSHETISLRTDIIQKLEKEELSKILSLVDMNLLKRKCQSDFSKELKNSNKSTYDLIKEALGSRGSW